MVVFGTHAQPKPADWLAADTLLQETQFMNGQDTAHTVESAPLSPTEAKLERIRANMYKFSKDTLGFTEEEARISAQNAVDAVNGKEDEE